MKKNLLLLMVAWLPVVAYCDKVTVHVETEGTLEDLITSQDVLKITDLTVTGRITAADISYLRSGSGRVINLETLDLNGVTLVESKDPYCSYVEGLDYYYYYLSEEESRYWVETSTLMEDPPKRFYIKGMNLAGAFRGTNLKKVVLPTGLKKVGESCFEGCSKIEEVILPDGMTAIDKEAFYGCALEQLQLPSSVVFIGYGAFEYAESLKVINLSSVKEIDYFAFLGCSSLKDIGSLSSAETIENQSFQGCSSLESVPFSDNLKELGTKSFYECSSLKTLTIPKSMETVSESAFGKCIALTEITIQEGVKTIDKSAFSDCDALTNITFPSSLNTINEYAFRYCDALAELTLPEGLVTIETGAFSSCTSLAKVHLPSTLKNLRYSSFEGTPWQESIAMEDDGMMVVGNVAVRYYPNSAFEPNATLVFREGIIGIADDFKIIDGSGFENVTDIAFPSTMENIGHRAFSEFTGLTSLSLPSSLKRIGNYVFPYTIESVNFPEGLEEIGVGAFMGCSKIEEIKFPSTLKRIGARAFSNCTGLSEITIPESIEELEIGVVDHKYVGPFEGCKGVIIVKMNAKNMKVGNIGKLEGLEKIVVSKNVEVLPDNLFYNCTPKTIEFEERPADSQLYLGKMDYSTTRSKLTSLTLPNGKISLGGEALRSFKLPLVILGEITSMGGSALSGCTDLTSVRLSDELTEIPGGAFSGCTGMTSINIPNNVKTIGDGAFSDCSGLTSITIGSSVTSIGERAFSDCKMLEAVHISDIAAWCRITFEGSEISDYLAQNRSANPLFHAHHLYLNNEEIKDLVIPDGITSIGNYAFYNCTELSSVTIPESITSIGIAAFYGCSGLTELHISDIPAWCNISFQGSQVTSPSFSNPLYYAHHLYLNDEEIKDLIIPESVTSIGNYAFCGCSALTNVISYITEPMELIGTFGGTKATLYVPSGTRPTYLNTEGWKVFPVIREGDGTWPDYAIAFADDNVSKICINNWDTNGDGYLSYEEAAAVNSLDQVFKENSSIISFDELKYFTGITSIGSNAFYSCWQLSSVTIPNNVNSIGDDAFYYCKGLTSVTIPDGVTFIGEKAFAFCSNLTSVTIGNGVTSININAFQNCDKLEAVYISDMAAWCGISFGGDNSSGNSNPLNYAHHLYLNDEEIKDLVIPDGVTSINKYAFYKCSGLTSVTIPDGVTSIGEYAFYDCSNLNSVTSYIKEPFEITSNTFTNCYKTLYVFAGTSDKYRNKNYWNYFNIVEMVSDIPGDANGDGDANQQDIDAIVRYITEGMYEGFIFENADMDGDGFVNVVDIVKLVNIIKSKSIGEDGEERPDVLMPGDPGYDDDEL